MRGGTKSSKNVKLKQMREEESTKKQHLIEIEKLTLTMPLGCTSEGHTLGIRQMLAQFKNFS